MISYLVILPSRFSSMEHQLFARTPAYAEQRLLLMAITVSLAVVVLVVTAATISKRSALPCIHEFWHAFCSWASLTVYHRWKTSRWCYTSAMETWTFTCPDTYAQSAIRERSIQAGPEALKAELNKSRKYADNIAGVYFIPFAIETSGVGACRPWSWYPRLVDVWHQRRMNHVLQSFFANVSIDGCDEWKHPMRSRDTPVIQLLWYLVTMIVII